jgi:putative SOS response-associated peptidase YedK
MRSGRASGLGTPSPSPSPVQSGRMCTRYISPETGDIERLWHVGSRTPVRWAHDVFPRYQAPFIRAARDSASYERELVVGQWSLVPWFAKTAKLPYPTCNARSEELAAKASYKLPWARGQRCIIPAESFFEPCWETGKHVPWRFRRADGLPWGLAGLWNTWTDKETGEVVESYTMLTINADAHPLMNRMHRPDPKRPPDMQDKRSVVPIAPEDVDAWLTAPSEQAAALVRLAPVAEFLAEPAG